MFKVCCFPGEPDYETLQAAKLTYFPLEKRDYKPYTQARICISQEGMHVQFHCFEAESLPNSKVQGICRPKAEGPCLWMALYADGRYTLSWDGKEIPEGTLQPFSGEDLQGVYWGGTFTVPLAQMTSYGFPSTPGETFQGNFYKICENPEKPHYGSFFPADFQRPLETVENLGTFQMVAY